MNCSNYKIIPRYIVSNQRNTYIHTYMTKYHVILPVYYGFDRNDPQNFEELDRYTIMIALVAFMVKNSSFELITIEETKNFNLNKEIKSNLGFDKTKDFVIFTEKLEVTQKSSKQSKSSSTDELKKKKVNFHLIVVKSDYYLRTIKLRDFPESNIVLSSVLRKNTLMWQQQFYFYNNITGYNKMQNNIFKYVLEPNPFLPSIKQLEEKEPNVIYGEDFENNMAKLAGLKEIKKKIYSEKIEAVKRMEKNKDNHQNLERHPKFTIIIKNTTYELPQLEVIKLIKKIFLKTY